MKKRWIGWFRPIGRGRRIGPLVFSRIEILGERSRYNAVITVPGSCGNAVQRNRFRRIVRAYLQQVGASHKPIWIRLSNQFRLPRVIRTVDWRPDLEQGLKDFLEPS